MSISEKILTFATRHKASFKKSNLLKDLVLSGASESSINVQLNRMISDGRLTRVGYATYSLPSDTKPLFIYTPSKQEISISKKIKKKFPFTSFCIWRPSCISQFMQHIPNSEMLLIDVERVAIESVFVYLQNCLPTKQILLNPSAQECERYITPETIIIRPLINEAPTTECENCKIPTIEKILVDAISDKELQFLQGAELYKIYSNVFERVSVNPNKLLRYASRRNRKGKAEDILKTIKI